MINFSHEKRRWSAPSSGISELKKRQKGACVPARLLASKRASRKAFVLLIQTVAECSNIGSEINDFVEQHTRPAQHLLDLVG
jgi:hypothetical protein